MLAQQLIRRDDAHPAAATAGWLRTKIRQLRPTANLLVLCGAVLAIAVALGTAALVSKLYQQAVRNTERQQSAVALILAEELDRSFQSIELVERGLIQHIQDLGITTADDYRRRMSDYDAHQQLNDRIGGLQQVQGLTLVDAQGAFVSSSRSWPVPPINVADRDYFKVMSGENAPDVYVSEPLVSRNVGTLNMYLVRKFSGPHGELLGMVLGAVMPKYIETMFEQIAPGLDHSICLFRRDGVLLARYPHIQVSAAQRQELKARAELRMAPLGSWTVREVSPLDGQIRFVTGHALPHYSMTALVTTTEAAALAPWRHTSLALAGLAVLMEAAVAGLVFIGLRQLRAQRLLAAAQAERASADAARSLAEADLRLLEEREERDRELQAQYARFGTALNNMSQGLCMFDSEHRLLVSNGRFARMFGVPKAAVRVGMSVDELVQAVAAAGHLDRDQAGRLYAEAVTAACGSQPSASSHTLADGRTIAVTYHLTEDNGWLATYEDITERQLAEAKLAHMAHYDGLTGLPNRVLFRGRLEQALALAQRGEGCAVHCLDLDEFKGVNDTLGHPIGDALLQAVAARLDACVRETDIIARLGGDEFAVIQMSVSEAGDAAALAERLIEVASTPFNINGHSVLVGASLGIALAPADGLDPDELLKHADLALYRAKGDGRGRYRFFEPCMNAGMQSRRKLELDLRHALDAYEFELFYQPVVSLQTGHITGFEALCRWRSPERGLVSPAEFIPIAEETGIIVRLGEWVLKEACREAARWPGGLRVAVNLSALQFRNESLVADVQAALDCSGLVPERLELEITETVMLDDTEATLRMLQQLRGLGVALAMDDFGIGYSSLSCFSRYPLSKIKIDQSFVKGLAAREQCIAVIRAVIGLGKALGLAIVAEGIETDGQLRQLRAEGCTEAQGFLFSEPLPASEVPSILRRLGWTAPPSADMSDLANVA